MPAEPIHINPKTGLLTTARESVSWRIAGTRIELIGPFDGKGWRVDSGSPDDWNWLRERGLTDISFHRRQDALRALTALHEQDPLPAANHGDLPALRRRPGSDIWESDCGRYTIRHVDGEYIIDQPLSRYIAEDAFPTLRAAQRTIAQDRFIAAGPDGGSLV